MHKMLLVPLTSTVLVSLLWIAYCSTMLSQFVHTSSKYVLEGVKNLVIRTKVN